jgi:hypothetical protein
MIGQEDLFPPIAGNLQWWVLELTVGTMKKGERMAMNWPSSVPENAANWATEQLGCPRSRHLVVPAQQGAKGLTRVEKLPPWFRCHSCRLHPFLISLAVYWGWVASNLRPQAYST